MSPGSTCVFTSRVSSTSSRPYTLVCPQHLEFTVVAKEVKLMALQRDIRIHQFLDDYLVRATYHQICLQHTQSLVALCRELGWLVNKDKSELEPKQVFNFVGYQFDLREGKVRPTSEHWQTLTDKIWSIRSGVSSPTVHVPHRTSDSQRKSCPPRSTSYETHSVALVKQLEGTRITRKGDSCSQVTPPSLKVGAGGKQCSSRLTITPTTPTQIFTDASKEGWGAHLNECTARGTWSVPESKLHINHLDLKAVSLALKRVPRPLFKQHSPGSHRQHNSRCLYQQTRGRKSGFLCALLWRILSWCKGKQVTLKTRHIPGRLNMIADKQSRLGQTIQTEWSLYPEVFMTICSWWHQPQVDLFATRLNNKTTTVCVTGSGLPGMGSECTQPVMGKSGLICLPTSSHLGQSGGEVTGLPLQQDHSDCQRVAKHALVLGSGGNVQSDSPVSAQPAQFGVQTIQPDPAQELVKPEPTCLAPRATAIKEQRGSTRSVYETKWTFFIK